MVLNENQQQAIETIDGQLVIVACPGSGKTTTLLNRINYMTNVAGIDPASILMVTFSRAAAEDMKNRYKEYFDENSSVYFGTIHAFCLALLRKFSPKSIGDGIIEDGSITHFLMNRLKTVSNVGNKMDFINDLLLDIGIIKNAELNVSDYKPKCVSEKDIFIALYEAYENYKVENNKIDFDDLLVLTYELLCNNKQALEWVQNKYKYILVDEYQDINAIQRDIIYKIVGKNGNLAVVGDDDQAIFGFRGATSSIMLNFKNEYPNARVIYLSENYRSNKEIVDIAGRLIDKNTIRFKKKFIAHRGEGGQIKMSVEKTREKEIRLLVSNIEETIKSGVNPNDIAVIYRINKQATVAAQQFINRGIDFKTNDSIPSIYTHWIYNDIFAYHRLAIGKGNAYDLSQTLNHPNRYLKGDKLVEKGLDKAHMIKCVKSWRCEQWKIDSAIEKIEEYFDTIEHIAAEDTPLKAITIMEDFGNYCAYLKEYADYRNEDVSELSMVLDELKKSAAECSSWDEWEKKAREEKKKLEEVAKGKTGVTLTTMHKAKGLEWKIVYIIDCVEGKSPYIRSKSFEELEEERRLFYVAMTRAKDKLVLMRSEYDGSTALDASRYIRESGIIEPPRPRSTRAVPKPSPVYTKKSSYNNPYASKTKSIIAPPLKIGDVVITKFKEVGKVVGVTTDTSGNIKRFEVTFPRSGKKTFAYPQAFASGMKKGL